MRYVNGGMNINSRTPMKKFFIFVLLLIARYSILAGNVITYTTTASDISEVRILNNRAFNVRVIEHSILDGVGTIVLDGELTILPDDAFYGRKDIVSIQLPNSILSIGSRAFRDCSALTDIQIPSTTKTIGFTAFSGCTSLKNILLPDSLTVISVGLFSECDSLCNVLIPSHVMKIESYAFEGCISLSSMLIPKNILSIEEDVFAGCTALSELEVEQGNAKYDSRNGCNAIVESATNTLIAGCRTTIIPDGILHIAGGAFKRCSDLECIALPQGLISVGHEAFAECKSLININIPESVQSMGYGVFDGCTSLPYEMLIKDDQVSFAIYADTYLVRVYNSPKHFTFEPGTQWIGSEAFAGCVDLEYIEIPSTIKGIGAKAFDGCYNLPVERGLQYADTYLVGPASYYDKYEDEYVGVRENIRKCTIRRGTKWIGIGAFSDCHALTEVIIPNSVEFIDNAAFADCFRLKKINLPKSLVKIGDYAFAECSGLRKIAIPEGIVSVGEGAFYECSRLKQISFPKTIVSIGDDALVGCYDLKKLYCSAIMPPSIYEGSFGFDEFSISGLTVYLSESAIESYKIAPIWKRFLSGEMFESDPVRIVPMK